MTTDPGDLVLDPTCGSGTTALVAEQWGRRWITTDTSRVAIALARARIMGSRFQYYLLTDSKSGQVKEAELSRTEPSDAQTNHDIRHGFVYQRVPHITLRSIANNSEIDVIWERFQETLEPSARSSTRSWVRLGKNGRFRVRSIMAGPPARRNCTPTAHRPPEGDRRLHRRQGRLRVPLRQALRGQEEGPRRRAVHGREPLAPPHAGRG
jgi:hypothetical protein